MVKNPAVEERLRALRVLAQIARAYGTDNYIERRRIELNRQLTFIRERDDA